MLRIPAILLVVLVGLVTANSHRRYSTPHLCDADDESSEECQNYNHRLGDSANNYDLIGDLLDDDFDIKFILYNFHGEEFPFTKDTFKQSRAAEAYIKTKPLKVLIHGFLNNKDTLFPANVRDAYLERMRTHGERYNVLVMDWGKGACAHVGMGAAYANAVRHVRIAAAKLAELLNHLHELEVLKESEVHLIGHSLGAHVAGLTSYQVGKLNGGTELFRISALDPAGPLFWKNIMVPWSEPEGYRKLNSSQAAFVDVYHTSETFGTLESLGDVDFYINGGKSQPSCNIEFHTLILKIPIPVPVLKSVLQVCSHNYATDFFAKSINDLTMKACFGCDSYESFKGKQCDCEYMVMGEHFGESLNRYPQSDGKILAYANVPKDTSVGSNYLQWIRKNGIISMITDGWKMLCKLGS